jgi:hypothetical protein
MLLKMVETLQIVETMIAMFSIRVCFVFHTTFEYRTIRDICVR